MPDTKRAAVPKAAAVVTIISLCALTVILARQTATLRNELAVVHKMVKFPYRGMWVPSFRSVTAAGESVTVGEAPVGHRQLLLVLTTTCQYCLDNLHAWETLAARVSRDSSFEVIGISLDSADRTLDYISVHRLTFPVTWFTSSKLRYMYRATAVPQTLVVNGDGQIAHARLGVLDSESALDSVLRASMEDESP